MFANAMNETLSREINLKELANAVTSMAKGKTLGHDGLPMEFFQRLWHTVGHDFHQMILRGIESGELHEGAIKGLISLIPKKGI